MQKTKSLSITRTFHFWIALSVLVRSIFSKYIENEDCMV